MTALSPGLSWLIFGGWLLAVVLIVAFFMGATRASREYEEQRVHVLPPVNVRPEDAPPSGGLPPAERPLVRVVHHIYDAEARGDFE